MYRKIFSIVLKNVLCKLLSKVIIIIRSTLSNIIHIYLSRVLHLITCIINRMALLGRTKYRNGKKFLSFMYLFSAMKEH